MSDVGLPESYSGTLSDQGSFLGNISENSVEFLVENRKNTLGVWRSFLGIVLRCSCNWRWIDEGVAVSSQCLSWPLRALLTFHRIRTVINLRGENTHRPWYQRELEDCQALGIVHKDVKLSARRPPEPATLLALLDAFEKLPQPILMKCAGGVDRSVFAAAIFYLSQNNGQGRFAARRLVARRQLQHLFTPERRWIAAFCDYHDATCKGMSLRHWLQHCYRSEAFKRFLISRGMAASWQE